MVSEKSNFILSLTDFLACSPDDSAPVILFISKLFAMEKSDLPQHQTRYIGLARVSDITAYYITPSPSPQAAD